MIAKNVGTLNVTTTPADRKLTLAMEDVAVMCVATVPDSFFIGKCGFNSQLRTVRHSTADESCLHRLLCVCIQFLDANLFMALL